MKKPVFVMCAVLVVFALLLTSLPCYAGKKSANTQAIQPAGEDGVINGCYKRVNGQLRVINSTDFCGPSEYPISWNQAGQSGLIDLANTYVKSCQNMADCFCDNEGWVLHGYATCPPGSVISSIGTPMDASDYGFHALCMNLDSSYANPASITIRCVGSSAESNCYDGVDNDADGLTDCDDLDCAADPACIPVPVEVCNDAIDNDADDLTDCDDPDCAADPMCLPPPAVEICDDGTDNDIDGDIDCNDADCTSDPFCILVGKPATTEICTDGIDNDGDGSIDCKDNNCNSDSSCKKKKK